MNARLINWAKSEGFKAVGIEKNDDGRFTVLMMMPVRQSTGMGLDAAVAPYYWVSNRGYAAGERVMARIRALGYAAERTPGNFWLKPLARRLGMGYIGLSTLCASRRYGAGMYFFGLVTDMRLAQLAGPRQDAPCQSCRKCVKACPTAALDGEGRIDLNLCIRMHMLREYPVPEALREAMGSRILGCTACQDACPRAMRVRLSARAGKAHGKYRSFRRDRLFDLEELLDLDAPAPHRLLREQIYGKNSMRRGRLCAQALLACANTGRVDLMPLVKRLAGHEDPVISEHARWALAKLDAQHK